MEEGGDTTTIYNQEAYDRIRKSTIKDIDIWEEKMVAWRIKEAVLKVYERNTDILVEFSCSFGSLDCGFATMS